jgi:hypothetical protein
LILAQAPLSIGPKRWSYINIPYAAQLAAAEHADLIAWACNIDGMRNM